jgi:hypothetical protein
MKKINIHMLAMMLLALLFADVVPAAEAIDSKKREGLWCFVWQCDGPPKDPTPPSTPLGTTKPAPTSKTTTEKS